MSHSVSFSYFFIFFSFPFFSSFPFLFLLPLPLPPSPLSSLSFRVKWGSLAEQCSYGIVHPLVPVDPAKNLSPLSLVRNFIFIETYCTSSIDNPAELLTFRLLSCHFLHFSLSFCLLSTLFHTSYQLLYLFQFLTHNIISIYFSPSPKSYLNGSWGSVLSSTTSVRLRQEKRWQDKGKEEIR